MNNAVQYQFAGNGPLVYALIRRREAVVKLRAISLDGAPAPPHAEAAGADVCVVCVRDGSTGAPTDTVFPEGRLGPLAAQRPTIVHSLPLSTGDAGHFSAAEGVSVAVMKCAILMRGRRQLTCTRRSSPLRPGCGGVHPTSGLSCAQLRAWKDALPLATIERLLQVLVPQVEKLCVDMCGAVLRVAVVTARRNVLYDTEILEYLKQGTLVGLLPVPPPIVVRKYQRSATHNSPGVLAYLWTVVYQRCDVGPPAMHSRPQPRGAAAVARRTHQAAQGARAGVAVDGGWHWQASKVLALEHGAHVLERLARVRSMLGGAVMHLVEVLDEFGRAALERHDLEARANVLHAIANPVTTRPDGAKAAAIQRWAGQRAGGQDDLAQRRVRLPV